jgi:integrase
VKGCDNLAKRRPNGDGMVRRRKDGRWEGRIIAGHKSDGRPIYKSVLAKTQKELSEKLNELKTAHNGVELTEGGDISLSAWLDKWMSEYKSRTVRPTTYKSYVNLIERHIKPVIGKKKLSRLSETDVQKFYNDKLNDGLSASSVRAIHMVLHQAVNAALCCGAVLHDPTDGAVLPKREVFEKSVLSKPQTDALLNNLKDDPIWYDFFCTEVMTGMRRGEICALKWEDFDENNGTLHIRRSVHYEHGEPVTGDTKTSEGNRTIVLPATVLEMLIDRKKRIGGEWIFPDPFKAKRPVIPQSAYIRLQKALKEAGLPHIRFHDLRHSFATMAASNGVDPRTLAGVLGHTNASFTLDVYTHVTTDMQKNAAEKIGIYITDVLGGDLKPWQKDEKKATV